MAHYELIIQFDTSDAREINQHQHKVAIVKEVEGSQKGTDVIWVAFSPFELNEVKWDVDYGIYVSENEVQNGVSIYKCSTVNPAKPELLYPCEWGTFGAPISKLEGENTYGIRNQYAKNLTFGLAQSVTANGDKYTANPLNAVSVLSKEKVIFTPYEKLKVFLHAEFDNGVVISDITSDALSVDLTKNSIQTIKYNKQMGTFTPSKPD